MANEFKNTEAFIRKYGKEVEAEIKSRAPRASGNLYKSIRFEVRTSLKEFEAIFKMEDYGVFMDKGVSGHGIPQGFKGIKKQVVTSGKFKFGSKMPPEAKSIKNWMSIKGIPKKESFGLRKSIWIFGIAPTNFFTIPTTRRQKQFEAGIEKNMALDFEQALQRELKK